jgi:predicted NUDIX family NTP pyrophosphohydrolase
MPKESAGLLLYCFHNSILKVLLVHPGGPFWAKKDSGVWSIPKGEFEAGESPLNTAIREVEEETGIKAQGNFIELNPVKQKSGKIVYAWALQTNFNLTEIKSNTFEIEWPPKSGIRQSFPEIDKAEWFDIQEAEKKILSGQLPLLKDLEKNLFNH